MLCTMCMHGVNKKTTWDCECGETNCRHITECSKCHKRKPPTFIPWSQQMPKDDPDLFKDNQYPNEREVVLTLRVRYAIETGECPSFPLCKEQLEGLVQTAVSRGMLTNETELVVSNYNYEVIDVPDPRRPESGTMANPYGYIEGKFREEFVSPFDQYAEHRGKRFKVLEIIPPEKATPDYENPVPLYVIEFEDGTQIQAWSEEVCVPEEGSVTPEWWKDPQGVASA